MSDDEIMQRFHMSEDEFTLARLRMTAYVSSISPDVVALALNQEILGVLKTGDVRRAISEAITAQRILVSSQGVVFDPQTQLPVKEPDHITRLEGVKTLSKLVKDNQPSGPATQVNVGISNSNTQNTIIGGHSFEARRRVIEERRKAMTMADAVVVNENEESEEVMDGEPIDTELDDPDDIGEIEDDEDE